MEVALVPGAEKLSVERGKKKAGRIAGDWPADTGKNPDDLEFNREDEDL